jgi:hypothetical protein
MNRLSAVGAGLQAGVVRWRCFMNRLPAVGTGLQAGVVRWRCFMNRLTWYAPIGAASRIVSPLPASSTRWGVDVPY